MRIIVETWSHHTAHPNQNATVNVFHWKLARLETIDGQVVVGMADDCFLIFNQRLVTYRIINPVHIKNFINHFMHSRSNFAFVDHFFPDVKFLSRKRRYFDL